MRHLLCEHQNTICELNADRLASKEAMQAQQTILENGLRDHLGTLMEDIHQVDIEDPVIQLKQVSHTCCSSTCKIFILVLTYDLKGFG